MSEGDEEIEDMPVIEDMHIDLAPIIRDALVLALPFTPVCSQIVRDCARSAANLGVSYHLIISTSLLIRPSLRSMLSPNSSRTNNART